MAGYQLLGIRSYFDEKTRQQKRYDAFFERRWRFDDLRELYENPKAVLDRNAVPEEERWNLYYTVAECGDGKREFRKQVVLPFDIDGLDASRMAEYVAVVDKLISPLSTIVASGNGLHFLFHLAEPISEKKFFDERRGQYKGVLKKLNREFEARRLPGKADRAIWDAARILRVPGTKNIKPDKQDPSKLVERECSVLRLGKWEPVKIDWEELSGVARLDSTQALGESELRKYKRNPGDEALQQCLFLKHCTDSPGELSEPEWYAAASIVGRFDKGAELFHAMSRGHPGYSPSDTDEKLSQAIENSGPRTCANINSLWGKCRECPLFEKVKSPVVIFGKDVIATEASGFYDVIPSEDPAKSPKMIPNYGDLLKAFVRDHAYKTISDMRCVYVFKETHYVDKNPIELKAYAESTFVPPPTDKIRTEFYHKVLANEVTRKSFFASGTENRINFRNGVLDLGTSEVLRHSPEFGFRAVLPYEYQPGAACPTFDWWIRDIMLGDESLVAILQEFMGYVLRGGEYRWHKALWLAGTGRNGKSTFIDLLKALIGHDNYATLSIKQIIQDKFASSMLDGKIANFSEETSPEELSDSGPFKNLTGDGEINAQKKYGDPYQFRNRAKLIMSYNEVPMLKDLSPGMLSRPIIVPFKRDLTEKGSQDKTLKDKLLAELPGVFNFALAGWRRLEEQGDFSDSEKSRLEMEEIRDASCSAAQWVREHLELLPKETAAAIKSRTLYQSYKAEVGQYAYSEMKFQKRVAAIPQMASRRRRTETGYEYVALRFRNAGAGLDF